MTDSRLHEDVSGSENFPQDDKLVVRWIEEQPISQAWLARTHFNKLLDQAAQPRHVSGNACIKLCHFIEQCRTSSSSAVRDVACSKKTCLDLFNFYVDWNEKNQHRSMRQILELVASILSNHPEEFICSSVKSSILHQSISIITHQASQPLVKPAFKSLECFLSKGTISTDELESAYKQLGSSESAGEISAVPKSLTFWDSFVSDVFDWMTLPDISPAAGKFLVTLFRELSKSDTKTGLAEQTYLWQRWIHDGLSKHPDALENIKYYLFPPLFKLDRAGSLVFLEDLNTQKPISDLKSQDLNAYSFLQLAALEAGKKAGLVEEPDTIQFQKASKKSGKYITIHEDVIGVVMAHNSSSVRSLAFSLLVSSSSSIRPFSSTALDILQENLSQLYADTDARFRNEVLTITKNMIERLRGATASLVREIENLSSFVKSDRKAQDTGNPSAIEAQKRDIPPIKQINPEFLEQARKVLGRHESFLEWYIELLMGEIIPTSSYQRHITALKAISLLLRSGIHEATSGSLAAKIPDNSTVWPYTIKFFTSRAMRLLLDLLMDPFEDVRSSATEILKLASPDCFTLTPLSRRPSHPGSPRRPSSSKDGSPKQVRRRPSQADILEAFTRETTEMWSARPLGLLMDFIARAEGVSKRTGRADYADGVARAYELLYGLLDTNDGRIGLVEDLVQQLERKVSIAENDLARAVLVAPVHGNFAALCFVWEVIDKSNHTQRYSMDLATIEKSCETWDNLQWRMLSACARIWETVKDVLCNDSPEGHLPSDLDDMDDIDTKDILSYSFRATHESSNLLRAMVSKIKSQWQNGTPILPSGLFADVGNLTFNQLASLRHRGAFSTVSLTFSKCCQLVQYQSPEEKLIINLLEEWYQGALGCIFDQASTTRRSAGIPALLTGILSANAATPAFQDVMTELKALAGQRVQLSETDETKLPQVHATNCLKEIFKSSSLGKRAEAHIADCLQLAADSLNSEIWAIRNCGLILLRSLIDCLFGTSESKLATEAGWDGRSIRISYDKYPALPELLLKLLDTETGGGDSLGKPVLGAVESVFPALDIIRRAGPPDGRREQIRKSVSVHLGSRVWHIREIAARTMCTLLLHDGWLSDMEMLFDTCDSSTNRLHGVLMTTKFVLKRRQVLGLELTTENFKDLRVLLSRTRDEFPSFRQCPDVFSALFEVDTEVLKSALHIRDRGANAITQEIVDDLVPSESHVFYENVITKYSKSSSNLAPHRTSVSSALLRNAIARKAIFAAALTNQSHILQIVIKNGKEDTDLILAALDCIPYAWKSVTSPQALRVLCNVYIETIKVCVSSEVRSVAVMNLAEVFDKLFTSGESHQLLAGELASLGKTLGSHTGSPQLLNAEIRISGSILLDEYLQQAQDASEVLQRRLEAWGEMISTAGDSRNDFDTRSAASAALNSFYINRQGLKFSPCFLASILALYDTLNDDDDEIREDAALTVSSLIGKSLVPLTAAKELLQYLWQKFRSSKSFARSVVCRITGNQDQSLGRHNLQLQTAEVQFAHAMADDDSLFIIEEQNLFIDEVRETKLWAGLFEKTLDSSWNDSATVLAAWVLDGLYTMKTLVAKSDAPLGWASKPSVFAQGMRVIICANSLLASSQVNSSGPNPEQEPGATYYIQPPIVDKIASDLESLILLSADKQLHESFISEILGPQPLVLSRKDALRLAKVTSRKKTALVKHHEYQQSQQHHERPQPSFRPTSYDRRLSNHSSRSLDQRNQSPQNLKSP